eukprot:418760-Amphidinium_carterae.1
MVAFNFAIGVKMCQSCFHVGRNHKATERLYQQLRSKLATKVRNQQLNIILNDTDQWVDCEADEVTLRKRHTTEDRTIWTEYLGIVRRGHPTTLVLLELESRPKGDKTQSSSAKAYSAELKKVAHTRVIHCKKKVNGKWLLPKYVEE